MKTKIFTILFAGVIALAGLCSCGGSKSSEPSALVSQSLRLNGELKTLAEESPMFLESIDVEYSDGVLGVSIAFSDATIETEDISEALVQFVLAQYLKNHTGANLDEILNTLSKEQGSLKITLTDVDSESREYTIGAARLKKLLTLKPMELNYSEVRTNVTDLLDERCEAYKEMYNAEEVEFEVLGGFAQYTLTFEKASTFAQLKQSQLTGRYQKVLQERYEEFGACRPMVEELLRSLSIDGYRYVYIDKNKTKTLSAALPWRLFDK